MVPVFPQYPPKLPTMPKKVAHNAHAPPKLPWPTVSDNCPARLREKDKSRYRDPHFKVRHYNFTLIHSLQLTSLKHSLKLHYIKKKSNHFIDRESEPLIRVAEVVRRHKGPSPKSLDLDKILSPDIRYFVVISMIKIVAI